MATKLAAKIVSLINTGRYAEAAQLCLKRIKKKPRDCDTLNKLGGIYLLTNDLNAAFRVLKQARKFCRKNDQVRANLGEAYRRSGDFEQAFNEFKSSIALNPQQSSSHNNLGALYYQQKDYPNAVKHFEKAIQIRPSYAQAIDNLALCYRAMGSLDEAAQLHLQANELDNLLNCVYLNLAKTLMLLHSTDDVCQVILTAMDNCKFSQEELLDLYITLAIVSWLTDQQQQLELILASCPAPSEIDPGYHNIKNITAYYSFLKVLLSSRSENSQYYRGDPLAPLFFIGDSHALSPANTVITLEKKEYRILSSVIIGCKAYHLGRKENDEYKESVKKLLAAYPIHSKVIFGFGEIDCRPEEGFFHIYKTKQDDFKHSVPLTVEHYFNFVVQIASQYDHHLYFYGVPAPVEALLESLSTKDQSIVKNIVTLFNESLKTLCQQSNIQFLDTYRATSDLTGGSNNKYHIDNYHLHPSTIKHLFEVLTQE